MPGVGKSIVFASVVILLGWVIASRVWGDSLSQNGRAVFSIQSLPGGVGPKLPGGQWIKYHSPVKNTLLDIDMLNSEEGWAVGSGGVILHYVNEQWQQMPSPVTSDLAAVSMVDENQGWAVGNQPGALLHYLNGQWTVVENPAPRPLYDLAMLSNGRGIAVGGSLAVGYRSSVIQADNLGAWKTVNKFKHGPSFLGVSLANDGSGWAVGDGVMLQFDENIAFSRASLRFAQVFTSVYAISQTEAWAAGVNGILAHYLDGQWQIYELPLRETDLLDVYFLEPDEGWAVGTKHTILYYSYGTWYLYSQDSFAPGLGSILMAIDMVSPSEGWIVGTHGKILHYQLSNGE